MTATIVNMVRPFLALPGPPGRRSWEALVGERLTGLAVIGHGKVTTVPDLALAQVSAAAEASTVAIAMGDVTEATRSMVQEATAAGVSEPDRQTRGMHLQSWRDRPGGPVRHHATQHLHLRLRDIATAGDVVQRIVAAGGDHGCIDNFVLIVDDRDPHLERAREIAMADAHRHAEQLARLAQRPLGPVLAVAENPGHGRVRDSGAEAMEQMARAASSGGPPVEAGELAIEVYLAVEYAWGD